MSGSSTPTPNTPIASVDGDGYVPGVCNIGAWEIRRRRTGAVAGFLVAAVLFAGLVAIGAPAWFRLVLLLPLWGGTVSWLQARRRFCVAFAMSGVSNFGEGEASRRQVIDPAQREADRRTTAVLLRDALLIAAVPTLIAIVLPV